MCYFELMSENFTFKLTLVLNNNLRELINFKEELILKNLRILPTNVVVYLLLALTNIWRYHLYDNLSPFRNRTPSKTRSWKSCTRTDQKCISLRGNWRYTIKSNLNKSVRLKFCMFHSRLYVCRQNCVSNRMKYVRLWMNIYLFVYISVVRFYQRSLFFTCFSLIKLGIF